MLASDKKTINVLALSTMKRVSAAIAAAIIFYACPLSGQQVFKCVDDSGTIIFSESPCGIDAQEMHLEDSQSGLSPYEPDQDAEPDQSDQDQGDNDRGEGEEKSVQPAQNTPQADRSSHDEQRLRKLERKLDSLRSKRSRQSPYASAEAKSKLSSEEASIQNEIQAIRQSQASNRNRRQY